MLVLEPLRKSSGSLTHDNEFLQDGTLAHLVRIEFLAAGILQKALNRIGCLNDVAQVEQFRPHKSPVLSTGQLLE
jgi:hypothetical protein